MTKVRRTRQLSAVYDAVAGGRSHPNAEQVFERVRRSLPSVSLGTVYRNLHKLVAHQELRVLQLADRTTRYDAMLAEHDHFVCEQCEQVTDLLRGAALPDLARVVGAGYSIHSHNVTIYGRCPRCQDGSPNPGR